MEMLKVFVVAGRVTDGGAGEHIERSGLDVDDGSGRDADFRPNKRTLHHVFRERNDAARLVEEADFPERRIARAVGVEGINAIVFGGDEEHVVFALAGNLDAGKKQRLRVDRAINLERAQLAELLGVDAFGSKEFFDKRSAGPSVVVLGSGDLGRGRDRGSYDRKYNCETPLHRVPHSCYCFSGGASAGFSKSLGSSAGLSSIFLNSALLVSLPSCLF